MKSKAVIILVVVLLIAAVAGFLIYGNKNNSNNDTNGNINPGTNSVDITGYAFSPATLTIGVGESVTWTNKDSVPHTITSDSGNELGSSSLAKDGTYSHAFNTAGTFVYHCALHPNMKGTIIVQ